MDTEPSKSVAELLARLRREMNGAVAEAMARRGIRYAVNYGVSAATIRQSVAKFAASPPSAIPLISNDALARELYLRPEREAILAALFLADPAALDADALGFWEKGVINSEVAEYLAFALVGRSAVAWQAFVRWSGGAPQMSGEAIPSASPTPLLRYCAAMTLLRVLTLHGDISQWNMARVNAFIDSSLRSEDPLLRSAAERLTERLGI